MFVLVTGCGDSDENNDMHSDTSSFVSDLSLSDEDLNLNRVDPLIYNGADITVHESMTAVLAFMFRHEVSGVVIADLLELINLHCKKDGNQMLTTLYFFKKHFSLLDIPVKYHYYCESCYSKLPDKKATCPNHNLHPDSAGVNVFAEIPLIQQLEALFSREEFFTNFNHSKNRTKLNPLNIEDIYDGRLYQELIAKGFFSKEGSLNFTMILNADGVPVFHSNNKSLWPVFLNVLELPPSLRFKEENTVIAGLWFGKKPNVNLILSPLLPSFQTMLKGFSVQPFGRNEAKNVQGLVLAATCDLPAKIMMLGMASYSGHFGCQICKIEGGSVKIVKKSKKKKEGTGKEEKQEETSTKVWVYKYTKDLALRNHDETVQFSKRAQSLLEITKDPKTQVCGVKFPSAMFKIMPDAIRGFAVDDLHTIYLGVTKTVTNLWFDAKHSSKPFSIRKHMLTADKRIRSVKLPNFLERGVMSIEELSNWKGKDYLSWLHYLSIPVLNGILPDKYLDHHIDLVSCIHLLQSSSICPNDLISCAKTLNLYVKNFEILYGSRHMSMVVHYLMHLGFVVTNLGPLRNISCFPYEGLNGEILKMIHGTRYIETQLASGVYLLQKLPHRLRSLKPESEVKKFCDKILHPSKRLKIQDRIGDETFSVGTYKSVSTSSTSWEYVTNTLQTVDIESPLDSFLRLKRKKHVFFSKQYDKTTRTNSYTCSYFSNGFLKYGEIDFFVRCRRFGNPVYDYLAIVQTGVVSRSTFGTKPVKHMQKFLLTGEYVAVPVEDLREMMVCIFIDGETHICDPLDHSLKS